LRGQVDVGALGFGVQGQVLGVDFHVSTFTTGRGWQGGKVPAPPARRVQLYVQCSTWNTCAGYNVRIGVYIHDAIGWPFVMLERVCKSLIMLGVGCG
jgi:hypothetical protein